MSTIKERVRCWLSLPQTEGVSEEYIDGKNEEIEKKFEGLQVAHRKLLERVMDLELREKYRTSDHHSMEPPPDMENLRPAYRRRSSLIREAQGILDAQKVPEKRSVDERGKVAGQS
jgi:hypothetical protein